MPKPDRFDAAARKVLDAATENLRKMRAIVRALPTGEDRSIASDYVEGASLSALADRYGMTAETMRSRLAAVGIPMRPATFREPDFYRGKAERSREEAERLDAIATIVQGCEVPPRALLARTTGDK